MTGSDGSVERRVLAKGGRKTAKSPEEGSDKVFSLKLCSDTEKQVSLWLRPLGFFLRLQVDDEFAVLFWRINSRLIYYTLNEHLCLVVSGNI